MDINKKIIQRAVAKSIVWDTGDLIRLIKKYEPINKKASYGEVLTKVQNLLATNTDFANEYTEFLLEKKRLADFNNAVGIISGISNLVSSIIGSASTKQQAILGGKQVAQQNTENIVSLMMQEEQARSDKQKQDNMLIIAAVFGMVLITGLMIYK